LDFTPLACATSTTLLPSSIKLSTICRASSVNTDPARRFGSAKKAFGP
jgi:hypothetical protein